MGTLKKYDAIILAGGKGTRVAHLHPETPKPLLIVNQKPFLYWILKWLIGFGVSSVVVSVKHFSDQFFEFQSKLREENINISLSVEEDYIDTGGGLLLAAKKTSSKTLLCLNGDTLAPFNLAKLVASHDRSKFLATMAAKRVIGGERYGGLDIKNGRVTRFAEKEAKPDNKPVFINTGVYCLDRDIIASEAVRKVSIEKDLFPKWLKAEGIGGFLHDAPFLDIGTEDSLALADTFILDLIASGALK